MSVQVISTRNLWPLPWYLRAFPHVEWCGVWDRLSARDVILVTPEMEPALVHELYEVPPRKPGIVPIHVRPVHGTAAAG